MGACGVSCMKYLVFLFNLLFALTGIAMMVIGGIIQTSYHHFSTFVGMSFWAAPILLICIGGVVFIISFFGCCGAVKESSCMVLTFSILLLTIFICEIGIGIAGYTNHAHLPKILDIGFNESLKNYESTQYEWNMLQKEMHCCGKDGPKDWEQVFHNETMPLSCCVAFQPSKVPDSNPKDCLEWSQTGCMPKLLSLLKEKSLILTFIGIGIALAQLIGVIFACFLYRAFRQNYETV